MKFNLSSPHVLSAAAVLVGIAMVLFVVYTTNAKALADDVVTIQRADEAKRNLYGSPDASITIVEFSDFECPYCATLHPTLKQLVDESDGQVAWEYRHLPLEFHPLAMPGAIVAECVAKHRGNQAFWEFTNALFTDQKNISETLLAEQASLQQVSEEQIEVCKADMSIISRIQTDTIAATTLGGSGTPLSVIIFPDNTYKTVSGAVPYAQWKTMLAAYVE